LEDVMNTGPVKRLSLKELEEWKAKAKALDEALEYLRGRVDCDQCMKVEGILRRAVE
jgi:hypothetical protein